jgi:hypothetical protein
MIRPEDLPPPAYQGEVYQAGGQIGGGAAEPYPGQLAPYPGQAQAPAPEQGGESLVDILTNILGRRD